MGVHSRREAIAAGKKLGLLKTEGVLPTGALPKILPPVGPNPYKSLRPFQQADSDTFFGREALVERLLSRLGEPGDIARLTGADANVKQIAISPNGHIAASVTDDWSVNLWDLDPQSPTFGSIIRRLVGSATFTSVAFGHDGTRILTGDSTGTVALWDVATGALVRRFLGHGALLRNVRVSPDGKTALSLDWNGTAILWHIHNHEQLLAWAFANRPVREPSCSEREVYHIKPMCDGSGIFPTATPLPPVQRSLVDVVTPIVLAIPAQSLPAGVSRTGSSTQLGDNRGEVPVGDVQVWHYAGQAGEILTISVDADIPGAIWRIDGEEGVVAEEEGRLDTTVFVTAPDGTIITKTTPPVGVLNSRPMDGWDDRVINEDSNSRIEGVDLPVDGIYQIVVGSHLLQTDGAYTLTIESQPPPEQTPEPAPTE